MNIPKDMNLPFFAYGIFKPGQLSYHRISDLVHSTTDGYVRGSLLERDGIPLLDKGENRGEVKGSLIYFQNDSEEAAYKRIVEVEPGNVYRWSTVDVNDQARANVLIGRSERKGSAPIEGAREWDGRDDPLFKYGLKEVETILKENSNFNWDCKTLFRLQMAYVFLWSIIERYAGLRYHLGGDATQKVLKIADEESFKDGLEIYVTSKRVVYRTSDLNKCTLDPSNPKKSIQYYYQVRSNAVHRGKAVMQDFDTIKSSLEELLAIFTDILNSSFS